MSDLREAAQQALDALEYYRSGEDYPSPAVEAITALRAALEQPEPRNQCGETCERAKLCAICARGLEQPEQEPIQIKPPNQEGKTLCAVRWMAETPAGWVGAWDREALQQFVTPPAAQAYPLPDDLYESKDWKAGSYAERVEWLHEMYESKKQELEEYLDQAQEPLPCPTCEALARTVMMDQTGRD